jgi:PUB domain
MELKSAEVEINELQGLYAYLRGHLDNGDLPELQCRMDNLGDADRPAGEADLPTQSALLSMVEALGDRLKGFEDKASKFRKRLSEKDPVTDKPRYGDNATKRVQLVLACYEELLVALGALTGDDGSSELMKKLREGALEEQNNSQERQNAEMEKQRAEEEKRRQEEQARVEAERRELENQRLKKEREEAERLEKLRLSLQAESLEAERAAQAEREWVKSIAKGPDGVRKQLALLIHSTVDDKAAQKTAINSLYTLFSQIIARPEEPNFRRIRRDHAKFTNDIGRQPGGKEILIAAGFVLGAVDEVPSFISKEPDVEKDLDGWSAWYDLLKAACDIIEEEMINVG